MEVTEAPEIPSSDASELEVVDLSTEITKDIETGKKPKKPRTEAQKAAFVKARQALAEKRKAAAEEKVLNKKKPGRSTKAAAEEVKEVKEAKEKPQKKEKKVQYVLEESSSSESSEEEEEVVYVKRSKGRKPRKKKGQKIVYVSSSSEEEIAEDTRDYSTPDPQLASLYSFV